MSSINDLINSINTVQSHPTIALGLNTTISKHLGLIDQSGRGTQVVSLDITTNRPAWSIPALTTPIKATNLLNGNKAKDEIAFKFILIRLQIRPISGSTWEDAIFNIADLTAIMAQVTKISPILSVALDNTSGYAVTAGHFAFHFKNSSMQKLGRDYHVPLQSHIEKDIINSKLEQLVAEISLKDFDVANNLKLNFEVGKLGPSAATVAAGITVNVNNTDQIGKKFNGLNKLLPFAIKVKVKSVKIKDSERIWTSGDSIVLQYIGTVPMNPETILTL